jgi:glutamine amidotransferase
LWAIAMPSAPQIAIVDYDMGNLHSARKGLEVTGATVLISHDPEQLMAADAVVLPGVGAFDPAMAHLQERDLITPLRAIAQSGKPLFGICLGQQLLFEGSEEGQAQGLGILKGWVRRFRSEPGITIPHMGWNQLHFDQPNCPLWTGLGPNPWVYFVHSYYVEPTDPGVTAASTRHGSQTVAAAVAQGNILATQFHPEKSGTTGLKLLSNFVTWVQQSSAVKALV